MWITLIKMTKISAWIPADKPRSFAGSKTPEGIAALRQFLTLDKPEFFAEQKMRPNEVL
jgi:hypothetical protein